MSNRFASLQQKKSEKTEQKSTVVLQESSQQVVKANRPSSRTAKKMIGGYFSTDLSKALNLLAVEEDSSVQALIGEAIDLLLRSRGKHPFGER